MRNFISFIGNICLTLFTFNSCLWAIDLPVDLYKLAIKGNENVVISPYGTSYAFAIAFVGSKGKTSDEIAKVFGFSKNNRQFDSIMVSKLKSFREIAKNGNVELISSAALWPENKYKLGSSFLKRTQTIFDNSVKPVNFSDANDACNIINKWVTLST